MSSILIVDDNKDSRWLMALLLSRYGYEHCEAGSGEEALKLVGTREFAVAVIDYVMPLIDGMTLFERLREQSPKLRGILLSGYLDDEISTAALGMGFDHVVQKPASVDAVLPLLEVSVGTWRQEKGA